MSDFFQNTEKTTSVWLTPPELVKKLGHFDLDPCSPNNLPWKLADKFYSLENGENGLELPWSGRVWCNPPYDNWGAFLEKLSNHGNGIALIFARVETKDFEKYVWNRANSILFIKGRLKFLREDFKTASSATAPSVLISYNSANTSAIAKSGIAGKLIRL